MKQQILPNINHKYQNDKPGMVSEDGRPFDLIWPIRADCILYNNSLNC